ncbi:MAG: hypothetical protein AAFY76_07965 [Cyanobacteria bacterium J06649_11]
MLVLESEGFEINNFIIPAFVLHSGEMLRFIIQQTFLQNNANQALDVKTFQYQILEDTNDEVQLYQQINPIQFNYEESLCPYPNIRTVSDYLKGILEMNDENIAEVLEAFEIKPEYKMKHLGATHKKLLQIIGGLNVDDNIMFDYTGLSLHTSMQLTRYIESNLGISKSAIGFDYLQREMTDYGTDVQHIMVWRKDKIGILDTGFPDFKVNQ